MMYTQIEVHTYVQVLMFSILSDIDECSSDDYPCSLNAHCTDTIGSFTCECGEGYSGNGFMCDG